MGMEYGISPFSWGKIEDGVNIESLVNLALEYYRCKKTPKELYNLALKKDMHALKIWQIYGERLGIVLSHLINIFDPEVVTIGGGLSNAFNYFNDVMYKTLANYCPVVKQHPISINKSLYKEEAALYGAAYLVKEKIS